jgi:mono/diheme cytochrome c family protein
LKSMRPKRSFKVCLLACAFLTASGPGATASAQGGVAYPYKSGKDIYEHVCQACHMPDAKGATGAGRYPALAGNPSLQSPIYPAVVILRGLKSMPPFAELDDEQIAAVSNYIRTSFGNKFAEPVTVEEVKALRSSAAQRRRQRAG